MLRILEQLLKEQEDFEEIFQPVSKEEYTERTLDYIKSICNQNEDGTWDCQGSVDLSNRELEELPVRFGKVKGDFYCSNNKLTSLEGAPEKVGRSFNCSRNELTSLAGSPKEVGWSFDCSNNKLTSLEGSPEKVGRNFDCSRNKITSLEGAPKEVGKNFYCSNNKLTSLEGAPEKVGWCFDYSHNPVSEEELETTVKRDYLMSKKEARSIEHIVEKFDPTNFPSFVHPEKKRWIELGDEQLDKIVPTLSDNEKTNLEMIASEEYQLMLSRLKKYTGLRVSREDLPQIVSLFVQALEKVKTIERGNRAPLERLALGVVLDLPEFKMVKDAYENEDVFFDIKLDQTKLKVLTPEVEPKEKDLSDAEEMNVELAKELEELMDEAKLRRRLANLFIQGMATLKMHLFNLVVDKLNAIDRSLVNLYGLISVVTQLGYWVAPPGAEQRAASSVGTTGGSSEVVPKDENYVIKARATIFPFLLHELVKGIYEWLSIDPDLKAAMKKIDSIEAETGDIILGPGFARAIQTSIPADKQRYLPLLYRKFLQLSKEDIKSVLGKSEEGKRILNDLLRETEKEWEEYERERRSYEYEISKEE